MRLNKVGVADNSMDLASGIIEGGFVNVEFACASFEKVVEDALGVCEKFLLSSDDGVCDGLSGCLSHLMKVELSKGTGVTSEDGYPVLCGVCRDGIRGEVSESLKLGCPMDAFPQSFKRVVKAGFSAREDEGMTEGVDEFP